MNSENKKALVFSTVFFASLAAFFVASALRSPTLWAIGFVAILGWVLAIVFIGRPS